MHDPEKFQAETIKAITDLQAMCRQALSRQLALGAVVRAILPVLPPEALAQLEEEFDASVDHLAAQLEPRYQQPRYWQEWSALIASLREQHRQPPPTAPGAG